MGKAQNRGNKEDKKKPTRSLKEKRAAKRGQDQDVSSLLHKHPPRDK